MRFPNTYISNSRSAKGEKKRNLEKVEYVIYGTEE